MTHDELTALAERVTHPPYGRYDEQAEKLAQGYLALSVKLEEAHKAAAFQRKRADYRVACYERLALLKEVIEDERDDLKEKLEEAHADRDAANQAATRMAREAAMAQGGKECPSCHTLLLVRGETAQPEVIKACPHCGWLNPVQANAKTWCCSNPADECELFAEPAYYQKVKGGSV